MIFGDATALTIYEFTPAADEIWSLAPDAQAGYLRRDAEAGLVTFRDIPTHEAKARPRVRARYAGGKATNVARLLDGLLHHHETPLTVRLVTFLPADADGVFSPGGAYIRDLQRAEMRHVRLHFAPLPPHPDLLAERRCIHLFDEATGTDLLNFSPRLRWTETAMTAALDHLRDDPPEGVVVLAGSAPLGVAGFYRRIIAALRDDRPEALLSADIDVGSLGDCLAHGIAPDAVSMNDTEYGAVTEAGWHGFEGIVHVHDHGGAWVWRGAGERLRTNPAAPHRIAAPALGPPTGPTIGAGDATHAGFLFAGLALGQSLADAAAFGQSLAAAAVRNPTGTVGLPLGRI